MKATRHELQAGTRRPYMGGWFTNTPFQTMLNTIAMGLDVEIDCYITVDLAAANAHAVPLPIKGWVMVADEERMALLHNGSVMLAMDADRGGSTFYLPYHWQRWELDVGDALLEPCKRTVDYGWVERAREAAVEDMR